MNETTIEIVCDTCTHRVRYHAAGQFACVVPGCNCTHMEPVEKEINVEDQHDIIKVRTNDEGILEVTEQTEKELEV